MAGHRTSVRQVGEQTAIIPALAESLNAATPFVIVMARSNTTGGSGRSSRTVAFLYSTRDALASLEILGWSKVAACVHKDKHNYSSVIIRIACTCLLLTVVAGCENETRTIAGKVVDETGATISGAAVSACYSGWGWSKGYLVWDKNFCSEPALTSNDGSYVINFKGPPFIRLRVRKDGWIQTQDFNTGDSRIFLTRTEEYRAKHSAEMRLREEHFRQRLPDESGAEYYCRVVLSRVRPISLTYRGEHVSVFPGFLASDDQSDVLFAVRGSPMAAASFANEAVMRIHGQTATAQVSIGADLATCESDILFIEARMPGLYLGKEERIEILVPSIGAMFDMQTWRRSLKP